VIAALRLAGTASVTVADYIALPHRPYTFRALRKTFGPLYLRCDSGRRFAMLQLAAHLLRDVGLALTSQRPPQDLAADQCCTSFGVIGVAMTNDERNALEWLQGLPVSNPGMKVVDHVATILLMLAARTQSRK
jgi:hypothetical protein